MKKKIRLILFLSVVLIAAFLRLWQLGNIPPSPDWDEVALGYNAYSIWETGKDEYGTPYPIVLRSFDDYKPALYTYLAIPSIIVFGLNVFAVRLPSAIFGLLTVVATFFLVKELSKKDSLALLSSFLLAISPWHIQFSRIAFESNIGLALNVFSVLFFLVGIRKPIFLTLSILCTGASLYVYQSEKIFTPLLFIILLLIYSKQLLQIPKKYIFLPLLLGFIVVFPITHYTLTNKEALMRAQGVSVFATENQFLGDYAIRNIINREKNDLIGLVLDNRRVLYAKFVVSNYLSHFDLNWLFISGDQARHHAPKMGLLYLWELPFLLTGIFFLIFGKFDRKFKLLIFGWFLITPIPASVSTGVPHAVRALNFLPTFQIFTSIGLLAAISRISKIQMKYLIVSLLLLFLIFNISYYFNQYFVQQNYYNSQVWQYGYQQLIDYLKTVEKKYDRIIVSNEPHLDQSYMFFLFYLKYSPFEYQKELGNKSGGFAEGHKFGKFEFRPIEWSKEIKKDNTLYIGRHEDFRFKGVKILKTFYFLDGQSAIEVTEG